MSKDKSQKETTSDESEIIEVEIIKEEPDVTPKSGDLGDKRPTGLSLSRIGWGVALIAIAFIGGIFAEPFAEQGLKRLGLMKEEPKASASSDIADKITPLNLAQQAQNKRLSILEAALDGQTSKITALEGENQNLKRDIVTLTKAIPTGDQTQQLSPEAIEEMKKRLNTIETEMASIKTSGVKKEVDESVTTRLDAELQLARTEIAQLLERLSSFEKSFALSQSTRLSDSAEGRAAVTLHRLYLNATAGANFSADIAALKPDLTDLPLLALQPVSKALNTLEANQAGIATHNAVVHDFNALIPALLKANVAEESTGWLAKFFTVRRTDARAEGIEATIRSIEIHLMNRDLTAADTAADNLPDTVISLMTDWRSRLKARENTLTALTSLLTTLAGDV